MKGSKLSAASQKLMENLASQQQLQDSYKLGVAEGGMDIGPHDQHELAMNENQEHFKEVLVAIL